MCSRIGLLSFAAEATPLAAQESRSSKPQARLRLRLGSPFFQTIRGQKVKQEELYQKHPFQLFRATRRTRCGRIGSERTRPRSERSSEPHAPRNSAPAPLRSRCGLAAWCKAASTGLVRCGMSGLFMTCWDQETVWMQFSWRLGSVLAVVGHFHPLVCLRRTCVIKRAV